MKRLLLLMIFLSVAVSVFAMSAIRNKTSRPIFLRLESGQTVRLLPGKTVSVTDKDLKNPVIADLIKSGDVVVEKEKGKK
ncbi:MAG: hypothetical protein KA369_09955 [Spirochaetes bacterium]|nr:hypothetical protein [Spirochaetota bacterium]